MNTDNTEEMRSIVALLKSRSEARDLYGRENFGKTLFGLVLTRERRGGRDSLTRASGIRDFRKSHISVYECTQW
jgi:hypothetical protein